MRYINALPPFFVFNMKQKTFFRKSQPADVSGIMHSKASKTVYASN